MQDRPGCGDKARLVLGSNRSVAPVAKQHLSATQTKMHQKLAAADPFTERVLKGDKTYYRARFAGFDKATAEATCKQLKRNDLDCITVRN